LASTGGKALVATFFTADVPSQTSSFAATVFRYMGLSPAEGMACRRSEDVVACQRLGVDWCHRPLHEAICRRIDAPEPFPYDSAASLFGVPNSQDAKAVGGELALLLAALPTAKRWLAPLGIGGHVDHRLLRRAAELEVERRFGLQTPTLFFYEDFPYTRGFRNRWRVLGPPWRNRLQPTTVAVASHDLEQKIEAIAAYTSQLRPLFGNHKGLSRQVRTYSRKVGGERLWSTR